MLVVYLVDIHMITQPHRPELRGDRVLGPFQASADTNGPPRTYCESAVLLYSAAVLSRCLYV